MRSRVATASRFRFSYSLGATSASSVPLLVRAYARARPRFETPVPLLIWGGSPGEWEGEHPYTVARELAVDGVFFSGWREHEEQPPRIVGVEVDGNRRHYHSNALGSE